MRTRPRTYSRSVAASAVSLSRCRISSIQTVVTRASTSFLRVSRGASSTSRAPWQHTFTLADVYNKEYNPKGSKQPADYRFPYEDETFDVAVLISVFTHMLPSDVDRYVGEIARVLKKNGRICASYSIITPESLQLMTSGQRLCPFHTQPRVILDLQQEGPEFGVAYDECYLRGIYCQAWTVRPTGHLLRAVVRPIHRTRYPGRGCRKEAMSCTSTGVISHFPRGAVQAEAPGWVVRPTDVVDSTGEPVSAARTPTTLSEAKTPSN